MLHSFLLRLRALLTRSSHRQQLADELAFPRRCWKIAL